jgi:hypothetical protein
MTLVSGANYTLAIEVAGLAQQQSVRSGSYTIKVPVASLSRTMQFIHRQGGKVLNVTRLVPETPPMPIAVVAPTTSSPEHHDESETTATESSSKATATKRGGKQKRR